jgi:5'-deoxynucleotidase YfbR-like HD superfamily hydrolase
MMGIRCGGAVKRWHAHPVHMQQTVASHSWGVAMVMKAICMPDKLSVPLLLAALEHDVAEGYTGDIPYQAKRTFPDLKAASLAAEDSINRELGVMGATLTDYEQLMLKLCDMLELMWFALEERKLGNRNMGNVVPLGTEAVRHLLMQASELRTVHDTCTYRIFDESETKAAEDMLTTILKDYANATG